MPGKFGADFNSNQPSDDDLVKKGAQWIRDIKTRLVTFLGVYFNLETGAFKDNILPYNKLQNLSPDPSGTWNQVTVNTKGLVTSGATVTPNAYVRPYRAYFTYTAGELEDATAATRGTDDVDWGSGVTEVPVATYNFTVPEGVYFLHVRMSGAGGGGGFNATVADATGGGSGGFTDQIFAVTPGEVFSLWVGNGGAAGDAGDAPRPGGHTRMYVSPSRFLQCYGGQPGINTGAVSGHSEYHASAGSVETSTITGAVGWNIAGGDGTLGAGAEAKWDIYGGIGGPPGDTISGEAGADGFIVIEYSKTVDA